MGLAETAFVADGSSRMRRSETGGPMSRRSQARDDSEPEPLRNPRRRLHLPVPGKGACDA